MPIQFACSCGRKLQASEEHAGRRVKCPACGAESVVPAGDNGVQPAKAVLPKPSPVQEEPRRPREDDSDERPARRRERRPEEDEEDRPRRQRQREDDEDEEDDRPRRRRRREDDEEDEDDERPRRADQQTSGKATAALVLGLLSFCLNVFTAVPAIIVALISLGEIGRSRGRLRGKGMAIAGLVLGCVGLVASGIGYFFLVRFSVLGVHEAAARVQNQNNLRQMVLAMHNYNDVNRHLPQAVPDPKVKSPTKLSWRVELLPYLEDGALYNRFHHDEPWDSPHNRALLTPMPKVFCHPNHPEENAKGFTYYRVFVGDHTPFRPGKVTRLPVDFPDGTSNTILIVEAADPVPWTKPDELEYDPNKPLPKLGGHFRSGTNVALADGSVVTLHNGLSERTLRLAIDPNDGTPLGPDWP